jgi:hypothetical protein
MASDVLVTHVDRVATVILNRPEAMNAVDHSLRRNLFAAFDDLARAPELRAIVLTGAGKSFARVPTSRAPPPIRTPRCVVPHARCSMISSRCSSASPAWTSP